MKKLLLLILIVYCSAVATAEVVTENLELEMNAALNGTDPNVYWEPFIGPVGATGRLESFGDDNSGILPVPQDDTYDGWPALCYSFDANESDDGARVVDLGIEPNSTDPNDFIFLPSKNFALELWVKPQNNYTGSLIKEMLVATQDGSSSNSQGFQLVARYDQAGQWRPECYIRGAGDRFYILHGPGYLDVNEWHQIVLVWNYDTGADDGWADWYYDGQYVTTVGSCARNESDPLDEADFMTPPNQLCLGARFENIHWGAYKGQMSIVRIYSDILSGQDILANYNAGMQIVADIVESDGYTEIEEGGATDSFDVVLNAAPSADVTVDLMYDTNQVSLGDDSLTFTTSNWDTPQTVTVTAVDDAIPETRSQTSMITFKTTSSDNDFDAKQISQLPVIVIDDDSGDVILSSTVLSVQEEGPTSDSFDVSLTLSPLSDDVVVDFDYDFDQISLSDDSLTFTTSNWDTPQTVTVTAIDDPNYEPLTHSTTITSSVASGSDDAYEGQSVSNIDVDIADNDCGPDRTVPGDINEDCVVDFKDFALMAENWSDCTLPTVDGCIAPWEEE